MKRIAIVFAAVVALAALITCAVCGVLIVRKQDDNHRILAATEALSRLNACYTQYEAATQLVNEGNQASNGRNELTVNAKALSACSQINGPVGTAGLPTVPPVTTTTKP